MQQIQQIIPWGSAGVYAMISGPERVMQLTVRRACQVKGLLAGVAKQQHES